MSAPAGAFGKRRVVFVGNMASPILRIVSLVVACDSVKLSSTMKILIAQIVFRATKVLAWLVHRTV